ncbi:hypothetical protein S83_033554 [Arachis hypogaea]
MAYPNSVTPFKDYAILGDDVLITDGNVASHYREILSKLGVQISGYLIVDLTPISVWALTGVNSSIGLCVVGEKYNVSSMNVLQRLAGAGYRVCERLMSTQSQR